MSGFSYFSCLTSQGLAWPTCSGLVKLNYYYWLCNEADILESDLPYRGNTGLKVQYSGKDGRDKVVQRYNAAIFAAFGKVRVKMANER